MKRIIVAQDRSRDGL